MLSTALNVADLTLASKPVSALTQFVEFVVPSASSADTHSLV